MSSPPPISPNSRTASGQSLSGTTIIRPRPIDVFPGSFALGVHEQQQRQYAAYPVVPPSRASSLHLPSVSMKEKEELMMDESDTEDKPMMAALSAPSEGLAILKDVFSWKDWANPLLWKAGVVEAVASCCFNFLTGLVPMTLSQWPLAAIPAGIFVANSTAVALLIFALSTATGAHINSNISISTTLSGLCHPVRMIVYVVCQTAGGAVGGAMLRVGVGLERALQTHNGGCWLEPGGPMTLGQAVVIEFMSVFSLLLICYGVGLDPRQAQMYGAAMGPVLIGITIGFLTAITATVSPGYTGAGMFPGRCFGLAVGIGELQSSHWIWWIPDFAAVVAHTILYRFAPPYVRETVHIDLGEPPKRKRKSKKVKTPQ